MFYSALSKVNSKNKKSIRFVAAGSYQIEFFSLDEYEYFTVYRINPDNYSCILINLDLVKIGPSKNGKWVFECGSSKYTVSVVKSGDGHKVEVHQCLWGWLPFRTLGGKVSSAGLATLKSNLGKYAGMA